MKTRSLVVASMMAFTVAVAPVTSSIFGFTSIAVAKGGNGNGGSGGGGNGGGGNGNGGGHGGGNSGHGKSESSRSDKSGKTTNVKSKTESASDKKTKKSAALKPGKPASGLAGLNSLKRNYHAYINSSDPRMAAISAYVMAYAEFEMINGPDVVPTDPLLGDDALHAALTQASKSGVVTEETLAWAKDVLGVGPAVGKIDQVRNSLEVSVPVAE